MLTKNCAFDFYKDKVRRQIERVTIAMLGDLERGEYPVLEENKMMYINLLRRIDNES